MDGNEYYFDWEKFRRAHDAYLELIEDEKPEDEDDYNPWDFDRPEDDY